MATHLAPSLATVQNVAAPHMRAMATAIVWTVLGLIGAGLGPTFMGMASDFFATRAYSGNFIHSCPGGHAPEGAAAALDVACRTASTHGLRMALICGTLFFLWAALHFLLASRTIKQDLYVASSSG